MKRALLLSAFATLLCACKPTAQSGTAPPATAAPPASAAVPAQIEAKEPVEESFVLDEVFHADTDMAALRARFGTPNVQPGKVPGAEGEESDGVILFADDPARRVYIYLQDQPSKRIGMARVLDTPSRWHFANGIGIGTTLDELVRRNGKPIRFYGLEWDYGGTITQWNGGALAPLADAPIHRPISLGVLENAPADGYPIGDSEFSSDDPKYPRMGGWVIVSDIAIAFDDAGRQ